MTLDECIEQYKLSPNRVKVVCPGFGLMMTDKGYFNNGRGRTTVILNGPFNQYGYLLWVENQEDPQYCVAMLSSGMRDLVNVDNTEEVLKHINIFLKAWHVNIEYLYKDKELILHEKTSHNWCFNLTYTYRSPKYNQVVDLIRMEPVEWQVPPSIRQLSNTMEGRFDPDSFVPEDQVKLSAMKQILENTL